MKKSMVCLLICVPFFLTACLPRPMLRGLASLVPSPIMKALGFDESTEDIVTDWMEELLDCIESKDTSGIKNTFAPKIVRQVDSFEQDVSALLDFFRGNITECRLLQSFGFHSETHVAKTRTEESASFTVNTDEKKYYIDIQVVILHEAYPDEVGIWSLNIMDLSETDYEDAIRSEEYMTPGIHILS